MQHGIRNDDASLNRHKSLSNDGKWRQKENIKKHIMCIAKKICTTESARKWDSDPNSTCWSNWFCFYWDAQRSNIAFKMLHKMVLTTDKTKIAGIESCTNPKYSTIRILKSANLTKERKTAIDYALSHSHTNSHMCTQSQWYWKKKSRSLSSWVSMLFDWK